ncbi:MAG: sugar phosphate isomerase/epimerase [Elusimicrobiota bacterium]
MKLGIITSSLRMELKQSLETAKKLGADGVQLRNVGGELDPEKLNTKTAREDFLHYMQNLNLEISALCGDLGGYTNTEKIEWLIMRSKQMVDLAVDLKTNIITTHIGLLTEDETTPQYKSMFTACKELGAYAENHGCYFAAETGPEDTTLMRKLFEKIGGNGLKINYDPANLTGKGFDHFKGVEVLKDYIVHTHAKDAVRTPEGKMKEVELGEGNVDFPKYIALLNENGYNGYYTIERELRDNPVETLTRAVAFMRRMEKELKV